MWLIRLPRRSPDRLYAVGLVIGLPALLLVLNGAPVLATVIGALAIGSFIAIVH